MIYSGKQENDVTHEYKSVRDRSSSREGEWCVLRITVHLAIGPEVLASGKHYKNRTSDMHEHLQLLQYARFNKEYISS